MEPKNSYLIKSTLMVIQMKKKEVIMLTKVEGTLFHLREERKGSEKEGVY
jgi:hypothetical protein